MRSKQQHKARHDDRFRTRIDQIINMKHELVVLADRIDWAWLDAQPADYFPTMAAKLSNDWGPPHLVFLRYPAEYTLNPCPIFWNHLRDHASAVGGQADGIRIGRRGRLM